MFLRPAASIAFRNSGSSDQFIELRSNDRLNLYSTIDISVLSRSCDFGQRFQVDLDFDVWPRCRGRTELFEIVARHAEIVALRRRGPMESHTRRFARLRPESELC